MRPKKWGVHSSRCGEVMGLGGTSWRFCGFGGCAANLISFERLKIVENSTVWGSEAGLCLGLGFAWRNLSIRLMQE